MRKKYSKLKWVKLNNDVIEFKLYRKFYFRLFISNFYYVRFKPFKVRTRFYYKESLRVPRWCWKSRKLSENTRNFFYFNPDLFFTYRDMFIFYDKHINYSNLWAKPRYRMVTRKKRVISLKDYTHQTILDYAYYQFYFKQEYYDIFFINFDDDDKINYMNFDFYVFLYRNFYTRISYFEFDYYDIPDYYIDNFDDDFYKYDEFLERKNYEIFSFLYLNFNVFKKEKFSLKFNRFEYSLIYLMNLEFPPSYEELCNKHIYFSYFTHYFKLNGYFLINPLKPIIKKKKISM